MSHPHKCAKCGDTWSCLEDPCQVEKAARINGNGPFCPLCFHLIFAVRYAVNRKYKQRVLADLLAAIWKGEN